MYICNCSLIIEKRPDGWMDDCNCSVKLMNIWKRGWLQLLLQKKRASYIKKWIQLLPGLNTAQQTFVLMKTSSRRLGQDQYICLGYTSSRHLQDVLLRRLQNVFKTSSRRLAKTSPKRFQDVFKTSCKKVSKTSSRHLQDVSKTSSKRLQDVFKMSSRRLEKRLQDTFKTSCKDLFKTFSRRIFKLNCSC